MMSLPTLQQRTLKMMNLMLHMYNARENKQKKDPHMEEYLSRLDDATTPNVFSVPEAVYLTPRISHQSNNDDMPRQLALRHKPRGLTFQVIISIDDDNSMLYADYGSSAIICYKHNSEPLDLDKFPGNDVFDYTFFSRTGLKVSIDSFIGRIKSTNGQFSFQHYPNLLSIERSTFLDFVEADSAALEAILSALWEKTSVSNFRADIKIPFNSRYNSSYPGGEASFDQIGFGMERSDGPCASTTIRNVIRFVHDLSPATYRQRPALAGMRSDVLNGLKRMSIVFEDGCVKMEVDRFQPPPTVQPFHF